MDYRQYGRSGLRVSALSLGAMTFGEAKGFMKGVHADDAEARRVFEAALEAGLDTVDTANGYAEGRSEELLGQWMKGRRQAVTLLTKCRFPTLGGTAPMHPNQSGLSRQSIVWNCEQSLGRLQTDYIDLYQVHMQDGSVPIEETLRALDDLQRAGKVRYIGCSNYTGARRRARAGAGRARVRPGAFGLEPARARLSLGQVPQGRTAARRIAARGLEG
jgi:aryl-alcohol dehydrogenase-like predicted oxidoreductase